MLYYTILCYTIYNISIRDQAAADSCVDVIVEVSGAYIVQERSLIEVAQ